MDVNQIRKYAKLAVCTGINLQPGQTVIIYAAPDQYAFAEMVMEECYKAGAGEVDMEWTFQAGTRMAYQYQSLERLSEVKTWVEEKAKWRAETIPCHIHILSDDPDGLAGVDAEKMQKAMIARNKILKPYRDATENKDQWTIVAVPSPAWAKKVFPEMEIEEAMEALWKAIFSCVHISEDNDPVADWAEHNRLFMERSAKLNAYGFDHLEYHNGRGTDFSVQLIPGVAWGGGGEYTTSGIYFNPNMPTEEIFTSPWAGRCEGTLVASKPLSYQGMLIEDFSVTFKEGRAVSWRAVKGEEVLERIITMDEGSHMLGELALVPESSSVSRTGVMFYETLFDENASCHVALGFGFSNLLPGFENMTKEEWNAKGINDSMTHVDFMIGTPDMHIVGVTKEGKKVDIFVDGEWAEEFR